MFDFFKKRKLSSIIMASFNFSKGDEKFLPMHVIQSILYFIFFAGYSKQCFKINTSIQLCLYKLLINLINVY